MASPSNFEQLQLELINQFRMNPAGEYDRLFVNGLPATPEIASAINYFGVDLAALKAQLSQLTSVGALAWSSQLASAAEGHSQVMIEQDAQTHQADGEPSLRARTEATGYSAQSYLGENVYAFTEDALHGHAGFVIDWGYDEGDDLNGNFASNGDGIQDPAGHRHTLISSNYTEIGISALVETDSSTGVGPYVVTQDLGGRVGYKTQFVGVVADDLDGDSFYDIGEGLGEVTITLRNTATGSIATTTSWSSGGWQIEVPHGTYQITFSGGGLASDVTKTATLGAGVNTKVDIYQPLDPLSLVADTITVSEDKATTFDPLVNDSGRGALTLVSVSEATNGTVTIGTDGRVTYRPDANFFGSDRFTYIVRDSAGRTSEALVTVEVTPVNDGPVIVYVNETIEVAADADAGTPVGIAFRATDIDGYVTVSLTGEATQFFKLIVADAGTGLYRLVVKDGAAFDAEGNPHISGTIKVLDDGGAQISQGFVVPVVPVPETPAPGNGEEPGGEEPGAEQPGSGDADGSDGDDDQGGETDPGEDVPDGEQPGTEEPGEENDGGDGDGTDNPGQGNDGVGGEQPGTEEPDPEDDNGDDGGSEQPGQGGNGDGGQSGDGAGPGGETPGGQPAPSVVEPDADNVYTASAGSDIFAVKAGGATIRGDLASLFGDHVEGFDFDDGVNIVGTRLARSQFFFNDDGTLYIDEDGDGIIDPVSGPRISFGDMSGGAFLSVRDSSDTWLVYERLLPTLSDGEKVDDSLINGLSLQTFLSGQNSSDFSITLAEAGGGYHNSLGVYEVDANGRIVDVRMLSADVVLDAGETFLVTDVEADHQLGFFLLQDGAHRLSEDVFASDSLAIDTSGGHAVLTDAGRSVEGATLFLSHDASLNLDGTQHVLSGASETQDGVLRVGFEDLVRESGGVSDDDFQDVIFDVAALADNPHAEPLSLHSDPIIV
ncbi:Ig-like domain-containing protein [Pacificimonas flava]|uniref:Uncharacterized protein n=1 Tax=Pacificimonas flava TaxID=1234595 RepID=M2SAJ6_9SPHN|nr:Ig-like domain-containing protein [Pacificimonas flava]EMD82365.1 hypothetical protein C725_2403 [Pacificimonas flava]MBB5280729.1 uncharacterized protein YkwD [Pacificimonas flava]